MVSLDNDGYWSLQANKQSCCSVLTMYYALKPNIKMTILQVVDKLQKISLQPQGVPTYCREPFRCLVFVGWDCHFSQKWVLVHPVQGVGRYRQATSLPFNTCCDCHIPEDKLPSEIIPHSANNVTGNRCQTTGQLHMIPRLAFSSAYSSQGPLKFHFSAVQYGRQSFLRDGRHGDIPLCIAPDSYNRFFVPH